MKKVLPRRFRCGYVAIEAGMAVRYDGGKKTHKWCDPINE